MCAHAKDFYPNTIMKRNKYMWVPVKLLLDRVIAAYGLSDLIVNGHILFEINK